MIQHIQNALCGAVPFYYVLIAGLVMFVIGCLAGKKFDVPAQMDREEFSRCVQLIVMRFVSDKAYMMIQELEEYCSDISIDRTHLSVELMKIVDEVVKE